MISLQRHVRAVLGGVRGPYSARRVGVLVRSILQARPTEEDLSPVDLAVGGNVSLVECWKRAGVASRFLRLVVLSVCTVSCAAHRPHEATAIATNQRSDANQDRSDGSTQSIPALSWDNPERVSWSEELIASIRLHKEALDRGDPEAFAPGYSHLSGQGQIKFWAELTVSISKYESGWDPQAVYHEAPPLTDSIGLMQLSYIDAATYHLERLDESARSLEGPLTNLRCAVQILAQLVQADGVLTAGSGKRSRGAARYWSVMREGPNHHLSEIRSRAMRNAGLL